MSVCVHSPWLTKLPVIVQLLRDIELSGPSWKSQTPPPPEGGRHTTGFVSNYSITFQDISEHKRNIRILNASLSQ